MSEQLHLPSPIDPQRRRLLLVSLSGAGILAVGPLLSACRGGRGVAGGTLRSAQPRSISSNIGDLGPLQSPDVNGLRLPENFTSRVVARAGQDPTGDSGYLWHPFPDGGSTYPVRGGGWIYVCNSEFIPGGVGALSFDGFGNVVDAYAILKGSALNCAGGATPWGTWLSCEEYEAGHVFECDPTGDKVASQRRALGTFTHEAVAVDPEGGQLYLTEDEGDGGFYRFTPQNYPDLSRGRLEIAEVLGDDTDTRRRLIWHEVPNPNPALAMTNEMDAVVGEIPMLGELATPMLEVVGTPTRHQVSNSTAFDGGEGLGYYDGIIYFTTKGDNRIWAFDIAAETIEIIYDDDRFSDVVLTGVDNLEMSAAGDVLVAEDGDDMQIVAMTPEREVVPIVQVVGQKGSEITGPAFSPDGTRLYFNSQRGPKPSGDRVQAPEPGPSADGITYEIIGPFFDQSLSHG